MRAGSQSIRSMLTKVGLLIFAFMLVNSAFAQQGTSRSIQNSPAGPITDSLERRNREVALRSLTMIRGGKQDNRVNRALFEQMSEDFKQIQLVRLGMVNDIKEGKPFEYKRLSNQAAEIRKHAVRLKDSLALFEQQKSAERQFEKEELDITKIQDAASDLCLEASRFIENPMFKAGAVYNVRYAAEAAQALDTVINLSTNIKNSADRLRKSN